MQRQLVKYFQGSRNVREVCKKSGRIYVQSNTVTERKFHFQIKSVVTESRGSHMKAFLLPKTVDRILQSKYRENHKVIEKKTVGYMFLQKNILRLQKEEKKYTRLNLYEKPRIFLFSCNVSTLYRIFLSGLVLCCS